MTHLTVGLWAVLSAGAIGPVAAPMVGERPPPLVAEAWYNAPGSISLDELRGHVAVLEVWAPWHRYSMELRPTVAGMYGRWKAAGARFVSVCLDSPSNAKGLVDEKAIAYPMAAGHIAAYDYGSALPTFLVLDPDGFVAWVQSPVFPSDVARLEEAVATALAVQRGEPATAASQPEAGPLDSRLEEASKRLEEKQYGEGFLLLVEVAANPLNAASGRAAGERLGLLRAHQKIRPYLEGQLREIKCREYLRLARLEAATFSRDLARRHYERILELLPDGADGGLARRELERLGAPGPTTRPSR